LKLCISAKCLAKDIVDKINSSDDAVALKGCNTLANASTDYVVVEHFISLNGMTLLVSIS
jgi:hypothetical protein